MPRDLIKSELSTYVVRTETKTWDASEAQRAELAANLADIERKKASRWIRATPRNPCR